MADGTKVAIENIKAGDEVLSYSFEDNKFVIDQVTHFFEHIVDEYLIINGHLKVTPNHPVFVGGLWVEAGDLKQGDHLLNVDNQKEMIVSIDKIAQSVKVYNLEVNPTHTYIADNVVVHNKPPSDWEAPCYDGVCQLNEGAGPCTCIEDCEGVCDLACGEWTIEESGNGEGPSQELCPIGTYDPSLCGNDRCDPGEGTGECPCPRDCINACLMHGSNRRCRI